MRQILAGIVALLVSLLGIVAPTAAMTPESPTQTPAYAYDGHPHLVVLTHTITERGPSHHHTRTISLDAADPLRRGSSTRPQGASVGTITTYDHPSTAGLVALATRTMQRFGEGSHVAISSPALSRVAANGAARLEIQLGAKIEKDLAKRGWSRESVDEMIQNPTRTVSTRDTRHLPGGGQNDAPATGYINRSGGYVVRNDETGDIVQVSNLNDPTWKSPW